MPCYSSALPRSRSAAARGRTSSLAPQGALYTGPTLRRPASVLLQTVFAHLSDAPGGYAPSSSASGPRQGGVLTVVTVDETGGLSKQKVKLNTQHSLDRVLQGRKSMGLIALNDPDTFPVAIGSLEELQYDREYIFAGDMATINILRRDDKFGVAGNNGGHGGTASTLSESELLAARLARLYPGAIPRPDLRCVSPSPNEPHHEAPLAAQHYDVALELHPESPTGSSVGSTDGASSNGNGNGKQRKPSLILGSYVAWLEGHHIDEAQKRIAALRRRASLLEEWPSYAKYAGYERIALVMLAHKIAEGEEDLVECLSSHHGIRVLLAEGNLDMQPTNSQLSCSPIISQQY